MRRPDPDAVAEIQDLWFEGDAWCKVAWLDGLVEPQRPWAARVQAVVAEFREHPCAEACRAVVAVLVDELLCAQMPDSSSFAELERGPWVPCSGEEAEQIAIAIDARLGCEASARALAWFRGRLASGGRPLRCDHPYAQAVVLLEDELGAFFFDKG